MFSILVRIKYMNTNSLRTVDAELISLVQNEWMDDAKNIPFLRGFVRPAQTNGAEG